VFGRATIRLGIGPHSRLIKIYSFLNTTSYSDTGEYRLSFLARMYYLLRCTEETEVATKSERDMKLLQQAISELQLELRTETKHAKESQCTKVGIIIIMAAPWNRAGHYIFALWFLLISICLLFFLA